MKIKLFQKNRLTRFRTIDKFRNDYTNNRFVAEEM